MTMKNDTKIEDELTCRFKIDMRNFTNLTWALESLKNLCLNWLLVTKVYIVWATEDLSLMTLKRYAYFEENIQKNLIWQGKKAKIKHSTLCNGYENGGLKNVDLRNKITSIQCSWVKRLFEDDFHDWKVIPLFLIGKHLGKNFKFHNNIDLSKDILSKFPSFYQDIFIKWINNYTEKPTLPSMILSEFIWFNSNIKVDSKPVHFSFFLTKT